MKTTIIKDGKTTELTELEYPSAIAELAKNQGNGAVNIFEYNPDKDEVLITIKKIKQ